MPNPIITVIIPTYCRSTQLRRAIESVLSQSYRDLRLTLFDNDSSDDTQEVCEHYARLDDRVIYRRNPSNIGPTRNIAQGIAAVETELYTLLSDDDFALPGLYAALADAFVKHPEIGFAGARVLQVDERSRKFLRRNLDWAPGVYSPSSEVSDKMNRSHFTTTGVVFRRQIREMLGMFDPTGNDRLYMAMAAAVTPFAFVEGDGAVYTMHSQSWSHHIGHGGLSADMLATAFCQVQEVIARIDIPAQRKTHLLMLAANSYLQQAEFKKYFSHLREDNQEIQSINCFYPENAVARIGANAWFSKCPPALHPLVRLCSKAAARLGSLTPRRSAAQWMPLNPAQDQFISSLSFDFPAFSRGMVGEHRST